jgi:hypothetical protein
VYAESAVGGVAREGSEVDGDPMRVLPKKRNLGSAASSSNLLWQFCGDQHFHYDLSPLVSWLDLCLCRQEVGR